MKNNSNNLVNQEIKILVIEDDDNQLIIIQESLRKLGFEVHSTMLQGRNRNVQKPEQSFDSP